MQINYKFISNTEPTDEQLHLLMQDVAVEVKRKAIKSDKIFWKQLEQLMQAAQKQRLILNSDAK